MFVSDLAAAHASRCCLKNQTDVQVYILTWMYTNKALSTITAIHCPPLPRFAAHSVILRGCRRRWRLLSNRWLDGIDIRGLRRVSVPPISRLSILLVLLWPHRGIAPSWWPAHKREVDGSLCLRRRRRFFRPVARLSILCRLRAC